MNKWPPARIMIVDDHPLVRRGLAELIAEEPGLTVCGDAEDAATAIQQVHSAKPDLVIVDLVLKGGHGIELIKQIRAHNANIKMLVSSMHDESLYAERALHAGASGYINKQETPDKVIEGIREVLVGNFFFSPRMTRQLLHRFVEGRPPAAQLPIQSLSDRELEVFELIGGGRSTREVAEHLTLSVKTVETYRENIKHKLDLKNGAELTQHAVQWVLERQ